MRNILCAMAILGAAACARAPGQTDVYTDPDSFQAMLDPAHYIEDFNSIPIGQVIPEPWDAPGAYGYDYLITTDGPGEPGLWGSANGWPAGPALSTNFSAPRYLRFTFTGAPVYAFGGYFASTDEYGYPIPQHWQITLSNGFTYTHAEGGVAFRGFITTTALTWAEFYAADHPLWCWPACDHVKIGALPTGACCHPDDTCSITTQGQCPDLWLGPGTTCDMCPEIVPPGDDCWQTPCGRTQYNFCETPLPADFFDPGSEPFVEIVTLGGRGAGAFDASMTRLAAMVFYGVPSAAETPIDLSFLDLVSCAPIAVITNGQPELWDVAVELSQSGTLPPQGTMAVTKTHANGGTYTADFWVQVRFTFTRYAPPYDERVLDTGVEGWLPLRLGTAGSVPWVHDLSPGSPVQVCGIRFAPGVEENPATLQQCCRKVGHPANPNDPDGHIHETESPHCEPCIEAACCLPDGTCIVVMTVFDCDALVGEYKGAGTTCRDWDNDGLADVVETADCSICIERDPCNTGTSPTNPDTDGDGTSDGVEIAAGRDPCVPNGACCLSDGVCWPDVTEADCLVQSGLWQGPGSSCDPNPCLPPSNHICVQITAQVVYVDDPDNLLGGQVYAGQTISGVYRYDASTPDSNPGNPGVGDYWHLAPPWGISVQAGNLTFATDPGNVYFLVELCNNWYGSDNYLLRSYNNAPLSSAVTVDHISWQLDDPTATALASDALPTGPPDLSRWQSWFGLSIEGSQVAEPWSQYFLRAAVTEAVLCVGACCLPPGDVCQVTTEGACNALGGAFEGPGTGCDPNPCLPVLPADCAEIWWNSNGTAPSGYYDISPDGQTQINAYCNMWPDRGWTVIDPAHDANWGQFFAAWDTFAGGLVRGIGQSAVSWRQWFLLSTPATVFAQSPAGQSVDSDPAHQIYRMTGDFYGCVWWNRNCDFDGECHLCYSGYSLEGTCPWLGWANADYTYPYICSFDWWNTAPSLGNNGTHCVAYTEPPFGETGACCLANGPCTVTNPGACAAQGGIYMGNSIPCAPSPCGLTGDLNCDGVVDFGDINPFVLYLSNFTTWQATYPNCPAASGDVNGDGFYPSFADINPFVALLAGG